MNEIVIEDVVYVWATRPPCPYNGTDRQFHIGKGAWSVHEGQMYMRKSLELD